MLGELIPIVAIAASAAVIIAILQFRLERLKLRRDEGRAQVGDAGLIEENRDLKRTVGRLEDRLAVLERIATDPAERTAREIESLR